MRQIPVRLLVFLCFHPVILRDFGFRKKASPRLPPIERGVGADDPETSSGRNDSSGDWGSVSRSRSRMMPRKKEEIQKVMYRFMK